MRVVGRLALLGVSLCSLSTPTMAQDTAAKDGEWGQADEIVVQARRRGEVSQDVPLTVNAVTAEDVQKLNFRDFKDVTAIVPGLSMSNNSNGIGTSSSVRGVNYDVNASGNNGTIEYYMNDAPVSAAILFTQMWDIGQIEVLRGPQGTLRGRASPSGSITVTTKEPDLNEVGGYVQGTVNNIGGWNGNAALNIPLIENVLGVRLSGVVDEGRGNRVHSLNSNIKPRLSTQGGRISVRAVPTDFLELGGYYQVIDTSTLQFQQMASFSYFSDSAAASPIDIRAKDRLSISSTPYENNQTFKTFGWNAAASFADQKLIYVGQHSASQYFSSDPSAGDMVNFFPSDHISRVTNTNTKQQSHEIRLQNESRVAGIFDYVVGYFHNTLNSPSTLDSYTPVALNFGNFGALATLVNTKIGKSGPSKEESIFGNLTAHIGESTEISGGIRRIKYHTLSDLNVGATAACLNTGYFDPCALVSEAHEESSFKKTIYNLSLKHRFSPNVMTYATFGTSWRPGNNVVGDFSVGRSELENSFLIMPPETSKSFELGFKTNWLNNRLLFNASIYQQDFKNYPYRSSSDIYFINYTFVDPNIVPTVGKFNFVGAVPVRVRGVEAEIQFKITPNWTIGSTLNYVDGKVKNGLTPCNDLNKDNIPDILLQAPTLDQLQGAYGANNLGSCRVNYTSSSSPKWSGVVTSDFSASVNANMDGFIRGFWAWKGKAANDPANVFDNVRSYSTLNLFLGLRAPDGAWEVSLFGKNVLRDRTVTSVSNGPLGTSYQSLPYTIVNGRPVVTGRPSSVVYNSSYVGVAMTQPREFGLTAKFAFGSR